MIKKGEGYKIKHIATAIYISLGVLLVSFNSFESYYPLTITKYLVVLVFVVGLGYLVSAIKEYIKKNYVH